MIQRTKQELALLRLEKAGRDFTTWKWNKKECPNPHCKYSKYIKFKLKVYGFGLGGWKCPKCKFIQLQGRVYYYGLKT